MAFIPTMSRRVDFTGRNDVYLHPFLAGDDVYMLETMGNFNVTHFRDTVRQRLSRVKRNWMYYEGKMFQQNYKDGAFKFYMNMCRPFVDKSADWLMKKPWSIVPTPGNEGVKHVLDHVWGMNNKELLSWKMAQMGGVTGDVFMLVTVRNFDPVTRQFIPMEEQSIEIKLMNSAFVHPQYNPGTDRMTSVVIQFPTLVQDWQALGRPKLSSGKMGIYTIIMNEQEIHEFLNDEELHEMARPNIFGEIPLVHIQNLPHAASFFGVADIDDIAPLNEELNVVGHSMRETIKYHSEPVTLIFGAKARELEKGASKTWSGLPVDSRVENLQLYGDQAAAKQFFDMVMLAMHMVGGIPQQALGELQVIANTSQAALEMQYMPLWEKTCRKYLTYGLGIKRVNKLVLRILESYFRVDLAEILKLEDPSSADDCDIEFASPFPRDETLHLNELEQKLRIRVTSHAQALRELNEPNQQQIAAEILSDMRAEMLTDVERAQATMGMLPNMMCLSQDSLCISFGLIDYFTELDEVLLDSTLLMQTYRTNLESSNQEMQAKAEHMGMMNDMQEQQDQFAEDEKDAPPAKGNTPPPFAKGKGKKPAPKAE
jgi:hypothetical protein